MSDQKTPDTWFQRVKATATTKPFTRCIYCKRWITPLSRLVGNIDPEQSNAHILCPIEPKTGE